MDIQPDTALRPDPIDEPTRRASERSQALDPKSPVARFGADRPLLTDAGVELAPFQIAYQTAGTLNAARSNAVLICHALTGDQYFAHTQIGRAHV